MNTTKNLFLLATAGVALVVAGCDSGSTCADGGVCADGGLGGAKGGASGLGGAGGGAAGGGMGGHVPSLAGGTYCYDILTVAVANDGCMLSLADSLTVYGSLPVTYTVTGGVGSVAVGNDGSIGRGALTGTTANLLRDGTPMDKDVVACTWHQTDMTALTVTADYQFTTTTTEVEETFAAACPASYVPAGGTCTSTWTWTFKAHSPATVPDPVTGLCPKPAAN